jgi:hypothetical protein
LLVLHIIINIVFVSTVVDVVVAAVVAVAATVAVVVVVVIVLAAAVIVVAAAVVVVVAVVVIIAVVVVAVESKVYLVAPANTRSLAEHGPFYCTVQFPLPKISLLYFLSDHNDDNAALYCPSSHTAEFHV